MGRGMGAVAPITPEQQTAVLKAQVAQLEASLDAVRSQISTLSKEGQ
jgi:hypothetical protein